MDKIPGTFSFPAAGISTTQVANGKSNSAQMTWRNSHTPHGVAINCDFFVSRARDAEIWDTSERRYIDFAAGIGVNNVGHCHPKVVAAVKEQLDRFLHTAYQVVPYASYVTLAERINYLTPGSHPKKSVFFSTGAEATENAVKIARSATGRPGIISFKGAFYGRTYMALSLTGKEVPYKVGFAPFSGPVYQIPFPSALHGVDTSQSLAALDALLAQQIEPSEVAAIFIEPVQGEGGCYIAPLDLMSGLRARCNQHGILLVVDEIQTGFGRTGMNFAIEHYPDVLPDMMLIAKSLGGGLPISGICGRAEVMDAPLPGGLGGTYAGNPLAVAAALAVLDILESESLAKRADLLGRRVMTALETFRASIPEIAEVRGLGAMIAVEFCQPGTRQPLTAFTKRVQAEAISRGLLVLTCGGGNVIRFLFPLTISPPLLEEGLGIFKAAVSAVSAQEKQAAAQQQQATQKLLSADQAERELLEAANRAAEEARERVLREARLVKGQVPQ